MNLNFKKYIRCTLNVLFGTQYHLLALYALSRFFRLRVPYLGPSLSLLISYIAIVYTSCDISPLAKIDLTTRFPHPVGIVIGEGVKIGRNTKIWQNVTIGSHGKESKQYPKIGDGVKVFSKSSILGNIEVGDGAIIGAHALVLIDVPSNYKAMGVPAKISSI